MPKNQIIDPNESRKKSEITFSPIPVNQYSPNIKNEVKELGNKRIIKIYKDMLFIREFETMLNLIKTQGEYEGIAYNHLGPAHFINWTRSGGSWAICTFNSRGFYLWLSSLAWRNFS